MSLKILVILGHPDSGSFCGSIQKEYIEAALLAGNEVRSINVGALNFDPVLKSNYGKSQTVLEKDLQQAQRDILWAEHLVFIYPIWWGGMPALLKGFIDRIFLPDFAFKYHTNNMGWDKLLSGRTAQLFVTMDSPAWYFRWVTKMPGHNQMKRAILEFCGVKPVKIVTFGSVWTSSNLKRNRWIAQVRRIASKTKK